VQQSVRSVAFNRSQSAVFKGIHRNQQRPATYCCIFRPIIKGRPIRLASATQFTHAADSNSFTTYLNIADNGGASPQLEKMTAKD